MTVHAYIDFDGVNNIESSRRARSRVKDAPGRVYRTTLNVNGLYDNNVVYSAESVYRLNALKNYGMSWFSLSTWGDAAVSTFPHVLRMNVDDWVPFDTTWGDLEERVNLIATRKYEALKAHHDGMTPFIWVDDEATFKFNPDDFTVPHLIITPDATVGLDNADLERIEAFVKEHHHV